MIRAGKGAAGKGATGTTNTPAGRRRNGMGAQKDCGSCGDCSCDSGGGKAARPPKSYGYPYPHRESSGFLSQRKADGPEPDATPLDQPCSHYECGTALRAQCNECIVSWVLAVGPEQAGIGADALADERRQVAARRIRQAISDHFPALP